MPSVCSKFNITMLFIFILCLICQEALEQTSGTLLVRRYFKNQPNHHDERIKRNNSIVCEVMKNVPFRVPDQIEKIWIPAYHWRIKKPSETFFKNMNNIRRKLQLHQSNYVNKTYFLGQSRTDQELQTVLNESVYNFNKDKDNNKNTQFRIKKVNVTKTELANNKKSKENFTHYFKNYTPVFNSQENKQEYTFYKVLNESEGNNLQEFTSLKKNDNAQINNSKLNTRRSNDDSIEIQNKYEHVDTAFNIDKVNKISKEDSNKEKKLLLNLAESHISDISNNKYDYVTKEDEYISGENQDIFINYSDSLEETSNENFTSESVHSREKLPQYRDGMKTPNTVYSQILLMRSIRMCYACSSSNLTCLTPNRKTSVKYCHRDHTACLTRSYKHRHMNYIIRDCGTTCEDPNSFNSTAKYIACSICHSDLCNSAYSPYVCNIYLIFTPVMTLLYTK